MHFSLYDDDDDDDDDVLHINELYVNWLLKELFVKRDRGSLSYQIFGETFHWKGGGTLDLRFPSENLKGRRKTEP